MAGALSKMWELAGVSARVLRADKELLFFPFVSAVMVLLVTAAFFVPTVLLMVEGKLDAGPAQAVLVFAYYLVTSFVLTFFNAALTGAALIRLRGGDPTVMAGLRIAMSRLGVIFTYSMIAATVGMVLRSVEGNNRRRSSFLSHVLGAAWSVATFLAVPVMMAESAGAIDSIKQSSLLLKKAWGDQLSGRLTLGGFRFLGALVLLTVGSPFYYWATETGNRELAIGASVGLGVSFLVLTLVVSALGSIYATAVYQHASGGELGEGFAREMVRSSLRGE
jgi:hypothetical protein